MADLHSTTRQVKEDRAICRALAILESRMREPGVTFSKPQQVEDYLRLALGGQEREMFMALFLDTANRLIKAETLFQGTIDQTSIHPREVVRSALRHNAAAVMFAHNHPSGRAVPSRHDLLITRRLMDALSLMDIKTLDHFVVTATEALSLATVGLLGMSDFPSTKATPKKKAAKTAKRTRH